MRGAHPVRLILCRLVKLYIMTKKNIYSKDACIIVKTEKQIYVTILPRVRVGYEAAIIISYPTSASGIIVLLKTPTKY